MSKWIVDIHGDIEGDYDIIKKYEEPNTDMDIIDLMYTVKLRLGELLALFLQGDDDKVYIYLYNGCDDDIIFSDIRIIDVRLAKYYNRKVTGLEMGVTLGIYIERGDNYEEKEKGKI